MNHPVTTIAAPPLDESFAARDTPARTAFRLAGRALVSVDATGSLLTGNPAFEDLIGRPFEQVAGRPITEFWALDLFDGDDLAARLTTRGAITVDAEPAVGAIATPPCCLRFVSITGDDRAPVQFGIQIERLERSDERRRVSTGSEGLRLSFDQLVVGMVIIGLDGVVAAVNEAYCRLVGREAEEFAELDVFALIHPDDRQGDLDRGVHVYAGEIDGWTREKRLIRKDGEEVWVLETVTLVRDDGGEPLHFLCQCIDITGRKAAEERQRESERRFKFLANGLPVGLMRADELGYIREANPALAEIIGRDPIGINASDVMHPDDRDRVALTYIDATSKGSDWQIEFRIIRPDGELRWMRANGRIHADKDGAFVAAMSIWTDVTELKAAEDVLRDQATTDSLTRLPNRVIFYDRLNHAIARSGRLHGGVAVLFVDLDNFKPVNDEWGHAAGDLLLQQVGERLMHCVRDGDTVARIGGDEFVVLAESVLALEVAQVIGERIVGALSEPFDLPFGRANIGASVGLAISDDSSTPQSLVRAADVAVYRAKAEGGNQIVIAS
jgi:diguanylate cyclase (GGDEF)-like protein/PAS domain S-box-containing protein